MPRLAWLLGACQSLTLLEGKPVGDPLEEEVFRALAGAALAMVLTVPSWACLFRRNGVEWADEREGREGRELEAKAVAAEALRLRSR